MISKSRPVASGGSRQVATYQAGQQCEVEGCDTILSRYNEKRVCSAHDPLRSPHLV